MQRNMGRRHAGNFSRSWPERNLLLLTKSGGCAALHHRLPAFKPSACPMSVNRVAFESRDKFAMSRRLIPSRVPPRIRYLLRDTDPRALLTGP